jgi:hypothetical protein
VNLFGFLAGIGAGGGTVGKAASGCLACPGLRSGTCIANPTEFESLRSDAGGLFSEEKVLFISGERNGVTSFLCCNFWAANEGRFCVGGSGFVVVVVVVSFFRTKYRSQLDVLIFSSTRTYNAFGGSLFLLLYNLNRRLKGLHFLLDTKESISTQQTIKPNPTCRFVLN